MLLITSEGILLSIPLRKGKKYENATHCWLCQKDCRTINEIKKDHDVSPEKNKEAAHQSCILNAQQKSSSFVSIFSKFFQVMVVIRKLNTYSKKLTDMTNYEPSIIPETAQIYVYGQVGFVKFLDTYRTLVLAWSR